MQIYPKSLVIFLVATTVVFSSVLFLTNLGIRKRPMFHFTGSFCNIPGSSVVLVPLGIDTLDWQPLAKKIKKMKNK